MKSFAFKITSARRKTEAGVYFVNNANYRRNLNKTVNLSISGVYKQTFKSKLPIQIRTIFITTDLLFISSSSLHNKWWKQVNYGLIWTGVNPRRIVKWIADITLLGRMQCLGVSPSSLSSPSSASPLSSSSQVVRVVIYSAILSPRRVTCESMCTQTSCPASSSFRPLPVVVAQFSLIRSNQCLTC